MALEKYIGRELTSYDKFKLWIISGRFFIIPLLFAFTFFAVAVAEGTFTDWAFTTLITGALWTASHYFNNYYDWKSGTDRISGGSIAKSYSAAPLILPYGLLSPTTVIVSAWAFLILSGILLLLTAPLRVYPFWFIGAFCTIFYTQVFKAHKIGEICIWLGFFSLGCSAYFFVNQYDMTGVMIGFFPAITIFGFWSLNQIADEAAKPIKKARGMIEKFVKGGTKQSAFFWFIVCSIFIVQFTAVLLGWLPEGTLLSVFALPIAHLTGITLDYEEKGMLLLILWITVHTFLMGLGVLYL